MADNTNTGGKADFKVADVERIANASSQNDLRKIPAKALKAIISTFADPQMLADGFVYAIFEHEEGLPRSWDEIRKALVEYYDVLDAKATASGQKTTAMELLRTLDPGITDRRMRILQGRMDVAFRHSGKIADEDMQVLFTSLQKSCREGLKEAVKYTVSDAIEYIVSLPLENDENGNPVPEKRIEAKQTESETFYSHPDQPLFSGSVKYSSADGGAPGKIVAAIWKFKYRYKTFTVLMNDLRDEYGADITIDKKGIHLKQSDLTLNVDVPFDPKKPKDEQILKALNSFLERIQTVSEKRFKDLDALNAKGFVAGILPCIDDDKRFELVITHPREEWSEVRVPIGGRSTMITQAALAEIKKADKFAFPPLPKPEREVPDGPVRQAKPPINLFSRRRRRHNPPPIATVSSQTDVEQPPITPSASVSSSVHTTPSEDATPAFTPIPVQSTPKAVVLNGKDDVELVVDNSVLGALNAMRKGGGSWLDLLPMFTHPPHVKRLVIPSIVADFEARTAIPETDKNGNITLRYLYEKFTQDKRFESLSRLLDDAMRIRIDENGSETIIKPGNPKIVIVTSPKQEAFFEELKKWEKISKDSQTSFIDELPFFRSTYPHQGEKAMMEYARSKACTVTPFMLTNDYKDVRQRLTRSQYVRNPEILHTYHGRGIGFVSSRGMVEALSHAYGDLTLPLFNLAARPPATKIDVNTISQDIKNSAPDSYDAFISLFQPDIPGISNRGVTQHCFKDYMKHAVDRWREENGITGAATLSTVVARGAKVTLH